MRTGMSLALVVPRLVLMMSQICSSRGRSSVSSRDERVLAWCARRAVKAFLACEGEKVAGRGVVDVEGGVGATMVSWVDKKSRV